MHISHRNVLELLAVNIDPETGALSMIAELMENGNIMQYIRTNEANRICLVRRSRLESSCELTVPKLDDVARGLSYLHKCGIIHGDVKGVSESYTPTTLSVRTKIHALTRHHLLFRPTSWSRME